MSMAELGKQLPGDCPQHRAWLITLLSLHSRHDKGFGDDCPYEIACGTNIPVSIAFMTVAMPASVQ